MIFQFLNGTFPDNNDRYLKDILSYSDWELEYNHNYIQVLFPLYEESKFNLSAPVLNDLEVSFIKSDVVALRGLNKSIERMIKFYKNNLHWMTPHNHNLLRITRIIKSISILISEKRSIQFYKFIIRRCNELNFYPSDQTLEFWKYATVGIDPPNPIMFELDNWN